MIGIMTDLRNKALMLEKACYWPDCNQPAIYNSHFVQRNGPLRLAQEDDVVYELRERHRGLVVDYRFRRLQIHETFIFRGFCQQHDLTLFKPIERSDVDWRDPSALVLLSYRGFLNEIRKKEKNIDWWLMGLRHKELAAHPYRDLWKLRIQSTQEELKIAEPLNRELVECIRSGNSDPFYFDTDTVLPSWSVITSSVLDLPARQGGWNTGIFFHMIPEPGNVTRVVFGVDAVLKTKLRTKLRRCRSEPDGITKFLTSLLIKSTETWCCNPSWFKKYIEPEVDMILATYLRFLPHDQKMHTVPFDLFAQPPRAVSDGG